MDVGSTADGVTLSTELAAKRDQLLDWFRQFSRCAVAYSGGVDSALVAKAAHLALGDAAVAVTATSDSLAAGELQSAIELAQRLGIRHRTIETREFENPDYVKNDSDRCYHCKSELYDQLAGLDELLGVEVIVNGANLDDRGDHRPGMVAAAEHAVRSPLIECGLTKADVRLLAADWDLPVWDKPASPCLSSRVAYGEEVTPTRLAMIDRAEQYLRAQGLRELRVRFHRGDLARIEIPPEAIALLSNDSVRKELVRHFRSLGFKFVTLDLEGFRSGSLNALVPVEALRRNE